MTAYDDLIVTDGPVLYLPLDDASGTLARARSGRNATYEGGPTFRVSGPGSFVKGIATDGVDDVVTTEAVPELGLLQPQTIELWVNASTTIDAASDGGTGGQLLGLVSDTTYVSVGPLTGNHVDEIITIADMSSGSFNTTAYDYELAEARMLAHYEAGLVLSPWEDLGWSTSRSPIIY